jgi:hypothetical protein
MKYRNGHFLETQILRYGSPMTFSAEGNIFEIGNKDKDSPIIWNEKVLTVFKRRRY